MGRRRKNTIEWQFPDYIGRWGGVEIDFDTHRPGCQDHNCDICRCTRLENVHVTDVNIGQLVEHIVNEFAHVGFKYAVDRIVRIHKMYDKNLYCISTTNGYYGEEIDDISFDNWKDVKRDLFHAHQIRDNTTALVEMLLTLEYGFLLDRLQGLTWELLEVPTSKLRVANDQYASKISTVDIKVDTSLPIGVYTQDNDCYRVVDGYHRLTLAKKMGLKKVSIFVGS